MATVEEIRNITKEIHKNLSRECHYQDADAAIRAARERGLASVTNTHRCRPIKKRPMFTIKSGNDTEEFYAVVNRLPQNGTLRHEEEQ